MINTMSQYTTLVKSLGIDKVAQSIKISKPRLLKYAKNSIFPTCINYRINGLYNSCNNKTKNDVKETSCIIIARVSSSKQKERFSLTEQTNYCGDYAKEKGFSKIIFKPITESAWKNKKRIEFIKILDEAIKSNIKSLVFYDFSRLSRNVSDTTTLKQQIMNDKLNIYIATSDIFLNKDSTEEDFGNFQSRILDAQMESDRKSTRSQLSAKALLSVGRYPGSILPIGYSRQSQEIIINKQEAELVKFIFNEYASQKYSLRTLLPEASKKALIMGVEKYLSVKSLDNLLRNSLYIGEMQWKGQFYNGNHQPIIDKDLFFKVQDNLMSNTIKKQKTRRNLPFENIFYCKECGTVLTPDKKKGKYLYHFCNKCKNDKKRYLRINNNRRKFILEQLSKKLVINEEYLNLLTTVVLYNDDKNDKIQINTAKKNLLIKEKELNNLITSCPANASPTVKTHYAQIINEKGNEIDTLKKSFSSDGSQSKFSHERVLFLLKHIRELFSKANDEDKSEIVQILFERITVDFENETQCTFGTEMQPFFLTCVT